MTSTDRFESVLGTTRGAHREPPTAQQFLASVGFVAPEPSRIQFIRGRWPYTYAYDYVRSHTPGKDLSRGEVGGLIRRFVGGEEADKDRICAELAAAYCAEYGIDVPADLSANAG